MPSAHNAHLFFHGFIGGSIHDAIVLAVPPVPCKLWHIDFSFLCGPRLMSLASGWPGGDPTFGPCNIPYMGRTTDAGFIVPHISFPPNNGLLPLTIILGSSLSLLGSSAVQVKCYGLMNGYQGAEADMAACLFPKVPLSLNLECWDPVPLPTDIVIAPNSVEVGITFADFMAALVDFAIEFALSAVFAFGGSDAVKGVAKKAYKKAFKKGAQEAAEEGGQKAVKKAVAEATDASRFKMTFWRTGTPKGVKKFADETAEKAARKVTKEAADEAGEKASKEFLDDAATRARKEFTENNLWKVQSGEMTATAYGEGFEAAGKAAKEGAKEGAERAGKEASEKVVQDLLKEVGDSYPAGSWASFWKKMTEQHGSGGWSVQIAMEFVETGVGIGFIQADVSGDLRKALGIKLQKEDSLHPSIEMTSQDTTGPVEDLRANTSPITVDVTFNRDVVEFTQSDIKSLEATVGGFTASSARNYSFQLTPTGQGRVTAHIDAGVAFSPLEGVLNHPFDENEMNFPNKPGKFEFTFDDIRPTVPTLAAVGVGASGATNVSPIPVLVVFSENMVDFAEGDLVVSNATVADFIKLNAREYEFKLTDLVDGDITVDIPDGVAEDGYGNLNHPAVQLELTVDTTPPVPLSILSPVSHQTGLNPIPITVTFDEDVKSFYAGCLNIHNGQVFDIEKKSDSVFDVTITPLHPGNVKVEVPIKCVEDLAGNQNEVDAEWSIVYTPHGPGEDTLGADFPDLQGADADAIRDGFDIIGEED